MKSLAEQYRPKTWDEVVGQEATIKKINILRRRGLSGRAFLITGQTGTGKTTIAKILASELADDFCIEEHNASLLRAGTVAEIERSVSTFGLSFGDQTKTGRVIVVNECHGLSKDSIRQLLDTLERIPEHVTWIFTTTLDAQEELFEDAIDAGPLVSRCTPLQLARRGLCPAFAKRAKEIAEAEGLGGKTLKAYEKLAKDCRNNFRAMLQAIETGVMMTEDLIAA